MASKLQNLIVLRFFLMAFLPLLVVSLFLQSVSQKAITQQALGAIHAVASIQEQRIENTLKHNNDLFELISKSNKIRTLAGAGDALSMQQLSESINNVTGVLSAIVQIAILNADGNILLTTDDYNGELDYCSSDCFARLTGDELSKQISKSGNELALVYTSKLFMNEDLIGGIAVFYDAAPLLSVTSDYSGLGETGETLLAMRSDDGGAIFINNLRFDAEASMKRSVSPTETRMPMLRALDNDEGLFTENTIDYRGNKIFAATRYIDTVGWGMVVKIDADEVSLVVNRMWMILGSAFVGLALLMFLLSRYLALEMRELAEEICAVKHKK